MAKTLGMVFGVIFVIVGVLGFIPNPIVGTSGLFMTDMLHNILHIIFGAVLIWAARKDMMTASKWMKIVAVIYAILAILGFIGGGSILGITMVNSADNWLHVVLAVVLWVGAMSKKSSMAMGQQM